jgi:hypothetical protein
VFQVIGVPFFNFKTGESCKPIGPAGEEGWAQVLQFGDWQAVLRQCRTPQQNSEATGVREGGLPGNPRRKCCRTSCGTAGLPRRSFACWRQKRPLDVPDLHRRIRGMIEDAGQALGAVCGRHPRRYLGRCWNITVSLADHVSEDARRLPMR